mmetsp:Transcript_6078/g.15017  ORF Transcript_6078/g.15017 Transcript_6078/m.15017 type:complete len:247 (+) Transcript_6078:2674-3414(+)
MSSSPPAADIGDAPMPVLAKGRAKSDFDFDGEPPPGGLAVLRASTEASATCSPPSALPISFAFLLASLSACASRSGGMRARRKRSRGCNSSCSISPPPSARAASQISRRLFTSDEDPPGPDVVCGCCSRRPALFISFTRSDSNNRPCNSSTTNLPTRGATTRAEEVGEAGSENDLRLLLLLLRPMIAGSCTRVLDALRVVRYSFSRSTGSRRMVISDSTSCDSEDSGRARLFPTPTMSPVESADRI